jgi:hypothetical protein
MRTVPLRLFLLHEGYYEGVERRLELLRQAAVRVDLECIVLDSLACDYSALPKLGAGDMLYNCARGSQVLESLLLAPDVATFYSSNPDYALLSSMTTLSMIHNKAGLLAPRTIYAVTNDRALLARYVDVLGGFPLILKVEGGSRGIGTVKVESWQSLISMADYLVSCRSKFVMRQFIDADFGVRAIVVGRTVTRATKFLFQEGDFRNAPILSQTRYAPIELTAEAAQLACDAVRVANLELGGVDLLFGKDQRVYLLEVNFPTGFQSFLDSPDSVVDAMLNHLRAKAMRTMNVGEPP